MTITDERSTSGPTPLSHRAWIALVAIALGSLVVSLLVGTTLFPHQSVNNDEAVYAYQGEMLLHGHVTIPAESHRDFFRPWMSGERDGRRVLVFQPVFPATLAVSKAIFQTMRMAPALIAAGCVLLVGLLAHEVFRRSSMAIVAAALMATSPLVLIHGGLYLEYLYSVLLQLATLLLVLRGRRMHSAARLVGAGVTMGVLFFMRPADALLLGLALAIYVFVEDRRQPSRAGRTVGFGALGAAPFVAMCFAYNAHVTGSALRFPLWVIGGENDFGFGKRQIVDGAPMVDVTFGKAWSALRLNLGEFPHWFVGSFFGVVLIAYAMWRLRRERIVVLLVAIAVVVPLGYVFYWGNTLIVVGRKYFGPHYYLALLIPACLLMAYALVTLVDERRRVAFASIVVLVLATGAELPRKVRLNDRASDVARAEDRALDRAVTASEEAIVILPASKDGPYLLHPRGWLSNPPDLDARVLYAADRLGQNIELFERFPGRRIYRLQQGEGDVPGERHRPTVEQLTLLEREAPLPIDVSVTNETGEKVAMLYLFRDFEMVSCVLDMESTKAAEYRRTVTVTSDAVLLPCDEGPQVLPLAPGPNSFNIGFAVGPDQDLTNSDLFEYRFWTESEGDELHVVTPPDQWRRDPLPRGTWNLTDGNPAIEVAVGRAG